MKIVLGISISLLCSGCAGRSITLVYYPHVQDPGSFQALAQRECKRYGEDARHGGDGPINFGRLTETFYCVPR